jgi:DNA-binding CsgD family transcriptional regulator
MTKSMTPLRPDAEADAFPSRRFTSAAGVADPRAAYAAARSSRDPGRRLLANALETITSLLQVSTALAFEVGARGVMGDAMLHHADDRTVAQAAPLVASLCRLEPIDPYSPRRALAAGAKWLSPADLGGADRVSSSMYGRRLYRLGYGPPVFMYFRRDDRIAAALALLRTVDLPRFDVPAVRLVGRLHPLLEHALLVSHAEPGHGAEGTRPDLGCLTAREAEVAALVAGGASNAAIAAALGMSEATVKAHLTKVYAKLAMRSRTQLAIALGGGELVRK